MQDLCQKYQRYQRLLITQWMYRVVGEYMANFTVKDSSCLARVIFSRRDHYQCGPDRAVEKSDTLLTLLMKHNHKIKLLHTEQEVVLYQNLLSPTS